MVTIKFICHGTMASQIYLTTYARLKDDWLFKRPSLTHLFEQCQAVVKEYINKSHTEKVPDSDLQKGSSCYKPASTTHPSDDPIAAWRKDQYSRRTNPVSLTAVLQSLSIRRTNGTFPTITLSTLWKGRFEWSLTVPLNARLSHLTTSFYKVQIRQIPC